MSPNYYHRMQTAHIQLEQICFSATERISSQTLIHGWPLGGMHNVEAFRAFDGTDDYIIRIESVFWASKRNIPLPDRPASWWDHFKRDAIPTFTRWLGLRVNIHREVLHAATVFPDVPQLPGGRYYYVGTKPSDGFAERLP